MRRLDRYILREILTPGIIALVALTFIVSIQKIGLLLDIVIRQSPTAAEVWAVVAGTLPAVLMVTLPMALLMGMLTGFGRMSSDSEIVALRASGVPIRRILRPVLVAAILTWVIASSFSVWVAPERAANLRQLQGQLALKYPSIEVRPRVFYEKPNWNYVLWVNDAHTSNGIQARGIVLVDTRNGDQPEFTVAESGSITPIDSNRSLQLTLSNSSRHVVSPENQRRFESYSFETNTIVIESPRPPDQPEAPPVVELPTRTLWDRVLAGTATLEETVEFHRRFALPFASFAFALMGLPLGISTNRGGRSTGLVMSLILMFIYYLSFAGGTRVTGTGWLSPALGAWLPNIVFCVLGVILLSRSDRRSENRILVAVGQAVDWIKRTLGIVRRKKPDIGRWAYTSGGRFRLFRLLDSYVLRGFWFFFAIVLGVFAGLFIVVTLFELLPDIVKYKIGVMPVVMYFVFLMPQIVFWVAPLAVLLAILINLGTLTKTNEVLAVKAGAVSLHRLAMPLLLMAALISGLVYVLQDYVMPITNRTQDGYRNIIKGRAPQTFRDPSRKLMMGSANQLYHYTYFDTKLSTFGNITILALDPNTYQVRERLFAKRANWSNGAWTFQEGWLRRFSKDRTLADERTFDSLTYPMDHPDYFKREVREADQMSYAELRRYVEDLRVSGVDVGSLTVDLYRKLSFPLVSFIMALIGIPFSFKTGRKGAFYGIGLCLGLGIIYWFTFQLFGKLGSISELSPIVAAWFPNVIFGASGFWMTLRLKT